MFKRIWAILLLMSLLAVPTASAQSHFFAAYWRGDSAIAEINWFDPEVVPESIVWTICTPSLPDNSVPGSCSDTQEGPALTHIFPEAGPRYWVKAAISTTTGGLVETEWRTWSAPEPARLVLENITDQYNIGTIETDRSVASVDWQQCGSQDPESCGPIHLYHDITESFGGTGLISSTVFFSRTGVFSSEHLLGWLPNSSEVNFTNDPVNKGELTVANLVSSQRGGIQSTNWRFEGNNITVYPSGDAFHLEIDTTGSPLTGPVPITVTETWLDSATGITSHYRLHDSFLVQEMPIGQVSCAIASSTTVACNASRPANLPENTAEEIFWQADVLSPIRSNGLNSSWSYAPGTAGIRVEGRTEDNSSKGFYVEWRAMATLTLYPLGSISCTTSAFSYICVATKPADVGQAASIRWAYFSGQEGPYEATLLPGQTLEIPRRCQDRHRGGLVYLTAHLPNGDILWRVLPTVVTDNNSISCSSLVPMIFR